MSEYTDPSLGEHLKKLRKRSGLSQRELAQAAGVSLSLVRKLEQGERQDTRVETARRLAVALRVPTSRLVRRSVPEPAPADEPWRPLQQAVEAPPDQPDDEPTLGGVASALTEVRTAYFENRLADLSGLLVPLLRDADALEDTPDARSLRAHLLQIAGSVLTQTRQYAAAETALQRALDDATDRLRAASVLTTRIWLLIRQGRLNEARHLAVCWADDLEPRLSQATPEELAAWGWLLLQESAASLRDNRKGEAQDTMRMARAVAVMTGHELPRGHSRLATWGPVTVAYKRAEQDIILDRPDQVLKVANQLRAAGKGKSSTEYHRHRLDVAKAHLMTRQYGKAANVLAEVHADVPEWLPHQRYAQDIMEEVVRKRRKLTPKMRELADTMGVLA